MSGVTNMPLVLERTVAKKQSAKLISPEEASVRLGVSKRTIFRMLERGQLRGRKKTPLPNSPVEIYEDSIEEADKNRQIIPKE